MLAYIVPILLVAQMGFAAVEPLQATLKKANRYVTAGVIVGGEHQRDLALIDLRRQYSKKSKLERLVFEMKPVALPSKGRAGFFHIHIMESGARVQMDIAGLSGAYRPLNELIQMLEKSPLIAKVEMVIDPEDRAASLTLQMKRPGMEVEAYELPSTTSGRLVVDIKEPR